jgi:hypothetical protein
LKHLTTAKPVQKDDDVESEVAPRTLPNWCQYPLPKLIGGGQLTYGQKDVANSFTSLPLLRKLFPNPLEPLLPAALLKNKGEMSLAQRKQHTEKAGTEWFSTGELDLMLSILACDGRYEDAAFIMPVSFSNILKDGVFAHARYKALLKLEKDNASMDEEEREDMIVEMLGENSEKIQKLQEQQQNMF